MIGEERAFGFFDPHLHIAVVDARKGEPPESYGAGSLYLVTVRARSDAARITLHPGDLRIFVRDRQGRDHAPVLLELEDTGETGLLLASTLAPGESFEQTFAFVVPRSIEEPALWISQITPLNRLLPFLEYSRLHLKVVVPLPE